MLQWVSTRRGRSGHSARRRSAARRAAVRLACSSSARIASASASTASAPSGSRVSTRSTAQRRLTAVGRLSAIRCASRRTASSSGRPSGSRCARAARATPSAPVIPMTGAPRTTRRRMASTTSSTVVSRRWRSCAGSTVWSTATIAAPSHSRARSMHRHCRGPRLLLHLHAGLGEVRRAAARDALGLPDRGLPDVVVGAVVGLDDLEGPQARQHVAADEHLVDLVGELGVPGLPQVVEGLLELKVGLPGAAVEGVEVPAGLLEHLERGRQLAERGHRLVADPVGHRVARRPLGVAGGAEPG